jgi:hypothetical protein
LTGREPFPKSIFLPNPLVSDNEEEEELLHAGDPQKQVPPPPLLGQKQVANKSKWEPPAESGHAAVENSEKNVRGWGAAGKMVEETRTMQESGWERRCVRAGHYIYISPDGKSFTGMASALKYAQSDAQGITARKGEGAQAAEAASAAGGCDETAQQNLKSKGAEGEEDKACEGGACEALVLLAASALEGGLGRGDVEEGEEGEEDKEGAGEAVRKLLGACQALAASALEGGLERGDVEEGGLSRSVCVGESESGEEVVEEDGERGEGMCCEVVGVGSGGGGSRVVASESIYTSEPSEADDANDVRADDLNKDVPQVINASVLRDSR